MPYSTSFIGVIIRFRITADVATSYPCLCFNSLFFASILYLIFASRFLANSVDWCGRRRLQREKRGQVRPRRSLRRGGSRTARGKRPPGVEINSVLWMNSNFSALFQRPHCFREGVFRSFTYPKSYFSELLTFFNVFKSLYSIV